MPVSARLVSSAPHRAGGPTRAQAGDRAHRGRAGALRGRHRGRRRASKARAGAGRRRSNRRSSAPRAPLRRCASPTPRPTPTSKARRPAVVRRAPQAGDRAHRGRPLVPARARHRGRRRPRGPGVAGWSDEPSSRRSSAPGRPGACASSAPRPRRVEGQPRIARGRRSGLAGDGDHRSRRATRGFGCCAG